MSRFKQWLPLGIVLLAVCATYANHFENGFHFDDAHAVIENPYIRSLKNLPRFFTDASTFSVLPANRTYRPFVSASLALDYSLAHGYVPFWFHLSTFLVFLLQLIGMYALFAAVLDRVRPHPDASAGNRIAALFAVAWYGMHPAMAETVNYIIQRGDIYCTVGVVAALALYVRLPRLRRTGFYLLPFAFGLLSKPPAIVFPALLWLYIVLFGSLEERKVGQVVKAVLPAAIVGAAVMVFESAMTPKTYTPSILSATAYRITQPYVLLRYFRSFFLPTHLNIDTDLVAFSSVNGQAIAGFAFVAILLAIAWACVRKIDTRPIAFGLFWFLVTSLPTSLYALSEVENDHRMFLPFVGLVLAVTWGAYLLLEVLLRSTRNPSLSRRLALGMAVVVSFVYAAGTHARNKVWRTDESLWLDDVKKCPHNGRGLMNYGLTQMAKGAYPVALAYFQRALQYTPNYATLEINLGIVESAMRHDTEAAWHFRRALQLAPLSDDSYFFYGRWLYQTGDLHGAIRELETAVRLNPSKLPARDLLATAYSVAGAADKARNLASETLQMAPSDGPAARIRVQPASGAVEYWINASLYQYQSGNYPGCIADAQEALKIKPDSALAYNNIGAAYAGMKEWDRAIQNEREALRIDPSFAVAKNNLATYSLMAGSAAAQKTAEDWLNISLRDHDAGLYQKSIQDAREALKLRPNYAEAYNNIAAAYEAMKDWDHAIEAAQRAVALKPDFQLAKNNLEWAQSQRKLQAR